MKISESTFEVLQNFSSINNGITVQEGSEIKTISPMKNIFGKATISDNFTSEFSVYVKLSLKNFLSFRQLEGILFKAVIALNHKSSAVGASSINNSSFWMSAWKQPGQYKIAPTPVSMMSLPHLRFSHLSHSL